MSTAFGLHEIRREDVPEGQVLCEYCTAKCCRYFALPIETPETSTDFEYIRWFLLHDRATCSRKTTTGTCWSTPTCRHLQPDNRCGIYETRPQICRDYTTNDCEYDDDWTYDFYLETPEQVAEYTEAVLPKKGKKMRSPKPALLPIL